MMIFWLLGAFALPIALGAAYTGLIDRPRLRREAEAAPRITAEEINAYWAEIDRLSLPIAKAQTLDRAPSSPSESRIGGTPLALGSTDWPVSTQSGAPMTFLAQINFADLPALEGFPAQGVLQIFADLDSFDDDLICENVLRWDPDAKGDAVLSLPKATASHKSLSETAYQSGIPLTFTRDIAPVNPFNWENYDKIDFLIENRLPENDSVAAMLENLDARYGEIEKSYGIHWVGGQPSFVQRDLRQDPEWRHLDRVLLHLGWDENVTIGDAGQLNVMISQDALKRFAFDEAVVTWDCY